jgi:hypothetical protein
MTEHRPRKQRWPKTRVRALAWATGAAAFLVAAGQLLASPKPPISSASAERRAPARSVIERHIVRRVVIVDPATSAPVSGSTSGSVSSGATVQAPAPAPPTTTTGGS